MRAKGAWEDKLREVMVCATMAIKDPYYKADYSRRRAEQRVDMFIRSIRSKEKKRILANLKECARIEIPGYNGKCYRIVDVTWAMKSSDDSE